MTLVNMLWGLSLIGMVILTVLFVEVRRRHMSMWMWSYVSRRIESFTLLRDALRRDEKIVHILFCMVDHFEPISKGSTHEQQHQCMRSWLQRYPILAKRHVDSSGRPVQHTWFYPCEDYNPEYLDALTDLCQQGVGEIEVHLHHGNDTSQSLREKLCKGLAQFSKHGATVTQEIPPRSTYGFIHGNLALDNSMGDPSICGVNDEISILRETGCYADFSMPTAPWVSQTKEVNSIYYAMDDPLQPKSHDSGKRVQAGLLTTGDLMIIQGPLGFDWHNRKWGILPKIDNAEVQGSYLPSESRVRNWVRQHVHVRGRPEWVIIKVSCHGAFGPNLEAVLGQPAEAMYSYLEKRYRDDSRYRLHYVTARELYNIIKAAEAGHSGDPGQYRDYAIPPYQTHRSKQANPTPEVTVVMGR